MFSLFRSLNPESTPPTARLVGYLLADHHNSLTGQCNPTITTLTRETSLSRGPICAAIRKLETLGHLTVVRKPGANSSYKLHPITEETSQAGEPVHDVDRSTTLTATSQADGPLPVHDVDRTGPRGGLEPERTVKEPEVEPEKAAAAAPVEKKVSKRQRVEKDCKDANAVSIPLELNIDGFPEMWAQWCDYRTEMALNSNGEKVWTIRAATMTLDECAEKGAALAVAALRYTMGRSWQGIVWDKVTPKTNGHPAVNGSHQKTPTLF